MVVLPGVAAERPVHATLRNLPWTEAVNLLAHLTGCRASQIGEVTLLDEPARVTLQFVDADLRTCLQLLAAYSGQNLVLAETVAGSVTLDLKEVFWQEGLGAVTAAIKQQVHSAPGGLVVVGGDPQQSGGVLSFDTQEEAPRVDLDLQEAMLTEAMARLQQQSGIPVRVAPDVRERISLRLVQADWRDALKVLARFSRTRVEHDPTGYTLTAPPPVRLSFRDANVRTVLHALAAYGGLDIVLDRGISGAVTLDLNEIDWEVALRAIAIAARCTVEVLGEDLICVKASQGTPNSPSPQLTKGEQSPRPSPDSAADEFELSLTGIIWGTERWAGPARAIINDRLYQAGDMVLDPETDEESEDLLLLAIEPRHVVFEGKETNFQRTLKQ